MDEPKDTTQEKPEDSEENPDEGDKPKELSPIDKANTAAERLEKATEAQKIENDRTENLKVNEKLGGGTEGAAPVIEKKKETPKEYAEKVMQNDTETS